MLIIRPLSKLQFIARNLTFHISLEHLSLSFLTNNYLIASETKRLSSFSSPCSYFTTRNARCHQFPYTLHFFLIFSSSTLIFLIYELQIIYFLQSPPPIKRGAKAPCKLELGHASNFSHRRLFSEAKAGLIAGT
jgi:hypothetical protein